MDRTTIFGGNPLGVLIRLALVSLVVGVVLSALGVTPDNLFYHLDILARRIYDLGFGTVEWVFRYLLLGAMVVLPVWLVARLFGMASKRKSGPEV